MITLLSQCIALLDAKPVLLIDDHQPQSRTIHILLNQGMRADGNGCLSIFDGRTPHHALALTQASRKQNSTYAKGLKHGADTLRMLLR